MRKRFTDNRALTVNLLMTGHDTIASGYAYRRTRPLPYWLILATTGGSARLGGDDWHVEAMQNSILLIEPNTPINQDADAEWQRVWALFEARSHWSAFLSWPVVRHGYRRLIIDGLQRRSNPIHRALARMHDCAVSKDTHAETWAMHALEEALLLIDAHNPQGRRAQTHPAVQAAEQYVARHLADPMRLDDVSAAAGVSTAHLSRLFRNEIGMSIQQYIERRRMEHAMRQLQMTSLPIQTIAEQSGFPDPFYFSTRFRKYTGRSPRAYHRIVSGDG